MSYSQQNIEQLFRLIGSFPQQHFGESQHVDYIHTTDSIWPNQLLNLKTNEKELDTVLDWIEKEGSEGTIPNLLMLQPVTKPNAIVERIVRRNYSASEWTAMSHNMAGIDSQHAISNFQIKRLKSKSDLKEWLTLVETELMGNHMLNADVFSALMEKKSCYFFLGLLENEPVSTSFLFVHEKGGGVYLVSTKSSQRKKGLGKAMTHYCLEQAKALGCHQVDLQATALGKGVYASLGFVDQGAIHVFRVKK